MIQVLQLGTEDWKKVYEIPNYIHLTFIGEQDTIPDSLYDIVFIDRSLNHWEIKILMKITKAHTLYITDKELWSDELQYFYACKYGQRIATERIQSFLLCEVKNYFSKPYGAKFHHNDLAIAQGFTGSVCWEGDYCLSLDGNYGEELNQIAYWRNNLSMPNGLALELWLEYVKEPGVEIALTVTQFIGGSVSTIQKKWMFSEQELKDAVIIDNQEQNGSNFVSLMAKGQGKLQLIALHYRHSRRGHGFSLPGGNRRIASNREEVFYYYDPGDLKPPLSVYFSGYKTNQGFEGYKMMRNIGTPFLLISEPRLEGGAFYMGSEEYESMIVDVIKKHMQELGFSRHQVIMSGMAMGGCGALYYSCDIKPHAVILGKPLVNIGDVAENERLHRPGGFPTSVDVLKYLTGGTDVEAINNLNARFWNKFDLTEWEESKFAISYMLEDDYDAKAYEMLISHIKSEGVQIYGKGIHGRHNDASGAIVAWFKNQYTKILSEDYAREVE